MSNTCKYEKYRRWISYDSGITWSPMNEYQKGELIERDSVDCGWEPTPPTPEVEYRWVDIPLADDFYCSGTTKYYKQKMQQSEDSGSTWTDVVPPQYRMGASAESKSYDCGYAERTTSGIGCDNANKVVFIYYQVSDDHGASWTTTSSTVDSVIEYDVAECGYATRTTSGSPYCVGVDKCVDLYHQVTRDGGTTWTTTSTTVSVIEYNSEDCGYVPPTPSYSGQYLTFIAREDGTFKFSNDGISYSLDSGTTWTTLARNTDSPTIQSGATIMWKGIKTPTSGSGIGHFSSTGAFDVKGNAMSLLFGDNFEGETSLEGKNWALAQLFGSCSNLISAEDMVLPATTLSMCCYASMFAHCTSLTTAPSVLLATTLANQCYLGMFYFCSSLTTAPSLPATTLADFCYDNMFVGCSSLTTAPQLPATTLASDCYYEMFSGCTSLTTAPELPATTLASNCYNAMFQSCTSLTTAPELPATTLANFCYEDMFYDCTSLNYIKCLATDRSATNCTLRWLYGVASTGTFTKASGVSWPSGRSGIPNGWTIQDAT